MCNHSAGVTSPRVELDAGPPPRQRAGLDWCKGGHRAVPWGWGKQVRRGAIAWGKKGGVHGEEKPAGAGRLGRPAHGAPAGRAEQGLGTARSLGKTWQQGEKVLGWQEREAAAAGRRKSAC